MWQIDVGITKSSSFRALKIISSVALTLMLLTSQGMVITIEPGQRIQAAIDSAHPWDTIEVLNSTYRENLMVTKPIILRGKGFPVVDASENESAITLCKDGAAVIGFQVTNSSMAGIKVLSSNNTIADNIATENDFSGIWIKDSSNNTVSGNLAIHNAVTGITLDEASGNAVKGNTARENGDSGIEIEESHLNYVTDNVVINNSNDGIELKESRDNLISGNLASGNKDGICLEEGSQGNNVTGNVASFNEVDGFLLRYSDSNLVAGNNASMNIYALFLEASSKNLVTANNFSSNLKGIFSNYYSSGNRIHKNNLENSNYNAQDESGANFWDDGTLGNRYSDFNEPGEGCRDLNNDGICDSGYSIPGGSSKDSYPLASWPYQGISR